MYRLRASLATSPVELQHNFRTVSFGAKYNIPISTIAGLFDLQIANGVSFGKYKRARLTITTIIRHIAETMDTEMRAEILKVRPLVAITIDGWRDDFGIEHALVSIRYVIKGKLHVRFLRYIHNFFFIKIPDYC